MNLSTVVHYDAYGLYDLAPELVLQVAAGGDEEPPPPPPPELDRVCATNALCVPLDECCRPVNLRCPGEGNVGCLSNLLCATT